MITLDPSSSLPINEQIKSGLRGLVSRGLLKPGDPAPSVRGLAAELKVNPNTVARALRELAEEGLIASRRGEAGSIAADAPRRAEAGLAEARRRFDEAVGLARRAGLEWDELESALRQARRRKA